MEYDFKLVHISGKKNGCADALSRCLDHNTGDNNNKQLVVLPPKFFSQVYARMMKMGAYQSIQDKVKQDQQESQASILQIKKWTNTHQLIKLNSIWWKGKSGQLVVARDNNLKRGVINFYHNSLPAGHPGISNTFKLAKWDFWWSNIKQDIENNLSRVALHVKQTKLTQGH
jgi:hypothetical protein